MAFSQCSIGAVESDKTFTLADLTTLGVGGPVAEMVVTDDERELIEAVCDCDRRQGEAAELLVLGGGSNLVVSDEPFSGRVVKDGRVSVEVEHDSVCGGINVEVTAGTSWDALVARAVEEGWVGIEALSGIPGTVGAAPVQNIGAYGREVGENLSHVRVFDRLTGQTRTMSRSDLKLGYRDSLLKRSLRDVKVGGGRAWANTGRWVVLSVTLQMLRGDLSAPIRYGELARRLDVEVGSRAPLGDVRAAVLELRTSKGMVYSRADHDTWSAGSFFTNPILEERKADEVLPFKAPRFPVEQPSELALATPNRRPPVAEGKIKTSAAWLIEQAGFSKGYSVTPGSGACLSSRHVLAITNRGAATSQEVVELARTVRDGVERHFGVRLDVEPVQVGVTI